MNQADVILSSPDDRRPNIIEDSNVGGDEKLSSILDPLSISYPITLTNLHGAPAVVIGGGPVGARKVNGLLAVGAAVRLVSPTATEELRDLADTGRISWAQRSYTPDDLAGARLVFAATNQRAVNAEIARDAAANGILCNVADAPDEGSFHLPAVYRGSQAIIAVSTGGASPAGAKQLRDRIARWMEEQQ